MFLELLLEFLDAEDFASLGLYFRPQNLVLLLDFLPLLAVLPAVKLVRIYEAVGPSFPHFGVHQLLDQRLVLEEGGVEQAADLLVGLLGLVDVAEVDGGGALVVAGFGGADFVDSLLVAEVAFVLVLLMDFVGDEGSALVEKIFPQQEQRHRGYLS